MPSSLDDLPRFRLDQAAIGQRIVVVEPVGEETRWRHFVRRERFWGELMFARNYLAVNSLRTVQGYPGRKPLWDSGENVVASQMPAATLVVDGALVNHDWTHDGLMIVNAMGWTGLYVNSQLVVKLSPFDRLNLGMVVEIVRAFGVAIAHANAEWNRGEVLPDDLTRLKLTIKET
jgi:hypothetical protein